jgi:hypothetical protein
VKDQFLVTLKDIRFAVAPAIFVFTLTLIIFMVTSHPRGLFLTRSIMGIPMKFAIVTLVLTVPILILPRRLDFARRLAEKTRLLGQLVKTTRTNQELSRLTAWFVRPLQGIGISLIIAERFLSLLEFSTGMSLARLFVLSILIFMGVALTSIFLSIIWTLDDLGVRIYNPKTGEIHMAGSRVGTVLPLITGAIGVSSLLHTSFSFDSLGILLQLSMVLYPPYVLFVAFHHVFIRKRYVALSEMLMLKGIEIPG